MRWVWAVVLVAASGCLDRGTLAVVSDAGSEGPPAILGWGAAGRVEKACGLSCPDASGSVRPGPCEAGTSMYAWCALEVRWETRGQSLPPGTVLVSTVQASTFNVTKTCTMPCAAGDRPAVRLQFADSGEEASYRLRVEAKVFLVLPTGGQELGSASTQVEAHFRVGPSPNPASGGGSG